MKMNMITKTLFIIALVMGTAMTAEAEVFTQARGQVQANAQERAVVANMQYAPPNPNVTCIRARIAYRKAKRWLGICKKRLANSTEGTAKYSKWSSKLDLAQKTYDTAFSLLKKVTVAKTETRMALKKFYVIENKAKAAEKKAIIAEEKAQLAKKLVTKYEKKEYVVRKCKAKPRHLTRTEKIIVKSLTKKVVTLKHKVVVIKKTIKKLTHQLP